MLVRHKRPFTMGAIMALVFGGVLLLIFSPVFNGQKGKINGMEYSDELFNKLAKGSSYFIPEVTEGVHAFDGKSFSVSVTMDKPESAERAAKMFSLAGCQATATDKKLAVSGNLGATLLTVLKDSDEMYKNDGAAISARYGFNEQEAMTVWWNALNKAVKELQKDKKVDEANIVLEVMRKGIEPSYNFYRIDAQRVSDKAFTMIGLLIFYVAYTMWWGYAIFYMFEGIGLSMKKAKIRKEV